MRYQKAQINSNQVYATNGCIRSKKLISRHVTYPITTQTANNVLNKAHTACHTDFITRASELHLFPRGGGERCYGGQPQGAVGVTEGWAPHGIRRWGSRRSLGTRSSSLRCTTCQQAQRLTGLNCLPLCVAVLGAPHVIYDHAAAAAPVAAGLCTSVALCSPNHSYPADHWGACNRDSRTCHVACVGEPRAEVERYSINLFFCLCDW